MTQPGRRPRVPALPPEERRAGLIAATIPLLRELGVRVSTRQIADAAGVAEGTIFKAFPDKASLLKAAILSALDPEPMIEELRGIDRGLDLRSRLEAAAQILWRGLGNRGPLLDLLRSPLLADDDDAHQQLMLARHRVMFEVGRLVEPDRHRLRRSPGTTGRLLLAIVLAGSRGDFGEVHESFDPREVVSLLLDGLLIRETP